ncbi:MAG: hypothetical protein IPG46_13715 [Actinobacteria bacterium]|nr:hypothetical protein [Actinomycetota bacterium]
MAGWALSTVVSEAFLNAIAAEGVGDGVEVAGFRQAFNLPMLGALDLGVDLRIVEVSFGMHAHHGDRLHAVIRASGFVHLHGDTPMPAFPGAAHVRGEVLVRPRIERFADGTFVAVLDLRDSELMGMALEGIDGIETDADAVAQMGQMLFAAVGGELFSGLAAELGTVGLELDDEHAAFLDELGVAVGPAEIEMHDGAMTVGLPSNLGVSGHAEAERPGGNGLAVAIAAGSLTALINRLVSDSLGMAIPADLDVTASEGRVGGRMRNQRLVDSPLLPDLRPAVRTTVRPRLVDGNIELSLREAWLELPLVPAPINRLNRWIGGVASRAPLSVSIPAQAELPVRPGSDAALRVEVTDLSIRPDGIALVIDASL